MKIKAVKGTRDLYPEILAPIRHIFDVWRAVSERHGFQEYEGPTLEMLDLYREKSGDELVGQLYRLTDSGGRELALRPEMTPTLARMVAAKINSLAKPLKWYCMPNLFRGENVQRGRLREFFQWNVDVIGTADMVADAECILVGVEALRELGLTAKNFAVHISNRRLIRSILLGAGVPEASHGGAYAIMDKAGKLDKAELSRRWGEGYDEWISYDTLHELLGAETLSSLREAVGKVAPLTEEMDAAIEETAELITLLQDFGITEFCKLDLRIVRGLAYYTGPVFEFLDRSEKHRAIAGAGRYDDLLGKLGKNRESAVGFGMGDVVLSLMLEELGLLEAGSRKCDVFVADAVPGLRPKLLDLVATLRRAGINAEFGYRQQAIGKLLKTADKRGASTVIVLGDETLTSGIVQVKDMVGGGSRELPLERIMTEPGASLEPS